MSKAGIHKKSPAMKEITTLFLVLASVGFPLFAQQRGANPITNHQFTPSGSPITGTTRAVVVGISDYQDDGIPDLRYAHKDAAAFATFLKSPAGGNLDDDHLKVLLNRDATNAQLAAALDWLMEETKVGEQVVIYFSGHGDVETKTRTNLGFLLTWDSPPRSYMAGAFPVFYLQEVVATLSTVNKARVILVTDACRSGKLAGENIAGAQLTGANLARQFANEIKILSCQPNEYSIEGEQWGGGRGAFSYHLIDGLYGLADNDSDKMVSLLEITRYLEDHVTSEVAPMSQLPMTVGNRTEALFPVDEDLLAKLKEGKSRQLDMLTAVAMKGSEEEVLAKAPAPVRQRYGAFQKAVENKQFLVPKGTCANDQYEQLMAEPSLSALHSSLRRNFAAALQDDAQQALNAWLKADVEEIVQSGKRKSEKYSRYPAQLERAAELLGKEHALYPTLVARKLLFEGYLTFLQNPNNPDGKRGEEAMKKFRQSLVHQPESAHTWLFMSLVWANTLRQPDSAYACAMKAAGIAPTWVLPYTNLAFVLSDKFQQYDKAKTLLDKAMKIDPNSALVWNYLGTWHTNRKQFDQAIKCYRKAIELDASLTHAYNNLCLTYHNTGRFKEAEAMCQEAIRFDSTYALAFNNLGRIYLATGKTTEAEQAFRQTIRLDPNYTFAYNNLGILHYQNGRMKEAENLFLDALRLDSTFALAYSNLGNVYRRSQRLSDAEKMYRTAIRHDSAGAGAWNNLGLALYLQQRLDESVEAFKKATELDPADAIAPYSIACLYSLLKNSEQSLAWLEVSLKKGFRDFDTLKSDGDLEFVRSAAGFGGLMKLYFPEKE
jgi:tetratricopeptide (TPR) repeat protein